MVHLKHSITRKKYYYNLRSRSKQVIQAEIGTTNQSHSLTYTSIRLFLLVREPYSEN
jgi:hypothetical protein